MSITRYELSSKKVTAIAIDTTNERLWYSLAIDNGVCYLYQTGQFDPTQIYYEISIEVDKIVSLKILGSYIYLAFEDNTYIGAKISLTNPLSSQVFISKEVGETNNPIDMAVNGTNIFYLFEGGSNPNSYVSIYTIGGVFVTTVDLYSIGDLLVNAISCDLDTSNNLWIVTNTSPVYLIRVYYSGTWQYSYTEII